MGESSLPPPQTAAQPTEAAAPSPTPAPAASQLGAATKTWQGMLLGRLERFKRYPPAAQMRSQQGVAYLRFTMDRVGNVLSARIEKSSGSDVLDEEALALVRRAEPLPKPPPEIGGDTLELTAPVQFFLNGRR